MILSLNIDFMDLIIYNKWRRWQIVMKTITNYYSFFIISEPILIKFAVKKIVWKCVSL